LKIKDKLEKVEKNNFVCFCNKKMELLKCLLVVSFFSLSLAMAEELNEDTVDPSTNYVFNLPDIVANYKTLGGEVQLEAFGASGVNIYLLVLLKNHTIAKIKLAYLGKHET
jgi:hypothetical protein